MSSVTTPSSQPGSTDSRINARFILIAAVSLCAIGLAIAALDRYMRARRDRQTIEWAERAMADGRYEEAAAQFSRAVARRPDDPDLSVKSGDAFYRLSEAKPETLQNARVAWEAAVRIRPDHLPALQRLLRFYGDLVEVRPAASAFARLGEVAKRVAALAPADSDAATACVIAPLGAWFGQAGPFTPSECDAHDKQLAALAALLRHSSTDGTAIPYYALATSRRALELCQGSDDSAVRQLLDSCERQIVAAAGVAEQDPALLYRAAEGLAILSEANGQLRQARSLSPATRHATSPSTTTQPAASLAARFVWPTWDAIAHHVNWDETGAAGSDGRDEALPTTRPVEEAGLRCVAEARDVANRAGARITPAAPHFVDVRLLQACLAQRAGDAAAAERICRATLAARPGCLRVQLGLAELLAAVHPGEALATLEEPADGPDAGPGPWALTRRACMVRATLLRARLWLDAAMPSDSDDEADPGGAARRSKAIAKAATACDELVTLLVDDADALKLIARLRMLQHRYTEALRTADRALALRLGKRSRQGDADLLSCRAASLAALRREPELAVDALRAVLEADPARAEDRFLLTRILIEEGRLAEAALQADALQRQVGDDEPRLLELRIWLLAAPPTDESDDAMAINQIHVTYRKLPERTVDQKMRKAEVALSVGNPADAVRLLQSASAARPRSVETVVRTFYALLADGQPDQAAALPSQALRLRPDDPSLLAARRSLQGPGSPGATEEPALDAAPPKFATAIRAGRVALDAGDLPRAKAQVDAAARVGPDDPALDELTFRYDLAAGQWGDAGVCIDKLAKANLDGMEGRSYSFRLAIARGRCLAGACVAREMTRRFEHFPAAWVDLGEALQGLGCCDRAIDSFRHASGLAQDNLRAIKGLAACYRATGQTPVADEWIEKGRKLAPADVDLREMELARQLAQGDPRRFIAKREALVQTEPQRPDAVVALARLYLRVNETEILSNPKSAGEALDKAVSILGEAVRRWPDEQGCSMWAARAAALSGDVAGGKQILRRLAEREAWAKRPEPSLALADFCLTWGDPAAAEVSLREAIARGATGASVAQRRSGLLMRQGAWQAALDVLRPHVADPLVQRERIAILVAAGRAAEAERDLRAAHESDPGSARVMTMLGMLADADRDTPRAIDWFDRAIAAGDAALAGRERAAIRLRGGTEADLGRALQELTIARQATPSDAGAAILLGEAYLRNGDSDAAARVLRASLAASPSDNTVRLALIALERRAVRPNWDRITALIEDGRSLSPNDGDWDAAEARVASARGIAAQAGALMRHAVQLASTFARVADPTLALQASARLRALWPDEMRMLLTAQALEAATDEADAVITRFGASDDMLAALAHHTRAAVLRRTGREDGGAAEYTSAIAAGNSAGGFDGAAAVVEAISTDAGADEAIRRIDAYLAATGGSAATSPHDPRWDLLRIDLLRRNGEFIAASAEVDKMMSRLATLGSREQIELLRLAVSVYLQDRPAAHVEKTRAACLALLQRLPNDAWALNNLAVVYIDLLNPPDPEKALEYARRAYEAFGRSAGGEVDPQIADTYGWALAGAGRGDEAVAVLGPADERLGSIEAQYHLAGAYLAAGRPQPAWSHLKTASQWMQRDQRLGRPVAPDLRRQIAIAFWRTLSQAILREVRGVLPESGGG